MRALSTFLFALTALVTLPGQAQDANPFDPFTFIEAEDFTSTFGTRTSNAGSAVGFIEFGDYLVFEDVAFGEKELFNGVVRASSETEGGTIEFRLGSIVGPLLATAKIESTGGWTTFEDFEIEIAFDFAFGNADVPESEDLYLIFTGGDGFLFDVDKFVFADEEVSATDLTITNCPTEPILVGEVYDFDAALTPVNTTNDFIAWTASGGTGVDYISGEFLTQTAGSYRVSATSFSNGSVGDQCFFEVTDGGQAAFNGPHTIPGTIEAEFFDVGGPDVAYRDDDRRQGNTSFRADEFVDVGSKSQASNGLAVGYTEDGEFLEYTLDSVTRGLYDITLTYSAGGGTPGAVELLIDSEPRVIFNDLVSTGGWNTFATTTETRVSIQRGSVLRLLYRGANFDLDKIAFTPAASSALTSAAGRVDDSVVIFPNPSKDGRFNLESHQAGEVRITDLYGRIIQSGWLPEGRNTVDLGAQPAGVYLLLTDERSHRLIKQ